MADIFLKSRISSRNIICQLWSNLREMTIEDITYSTRRSVSNTPNINISYFSGMCILSLNLIYSFPCILNISKVVFKIVIIVSDFCLFYVDINTVSYRFIFRPVFISFMLTCCPLKFIPFKH